MDPKEILEQTQKLISGHADGNPDKWWYANRYVYARLQQDERKTKTDIKRRLFDASTPCHRCGKPFETKRNVHLHRLDGNKGYSDANCALMHADCHQQTHAGPAAEDAAMPEECGVLVKYSKRHDDKPFLYWWDISPSLADSLGKIDAVEFVKKDNGERCCVRSSDLERFLSPDRQTTRVGGPWGTKVLRDRQDELAFEPGTGGGEWLFLPVVWIDEEGED